MIDSITDFFIWVVTHVPQLVILLIIIGIALLIIRILKKRGKLQKIKPQYQSRKKNGDLTKENIGNAQMIGETKENSSEKDVKKDN